MPVNIDITLQPKQLEFAKLLEAKGTGIATVLGYGGALGGGKSGLLRRAMIDRRFRYKETDGIIVRRVFDDVKKNHIDPFFKEFPALQKYYHTGNHEIRLPKGSKIIFMFAETTQEVERKFTGPEFFDIFVDQAEQFSEHELQWMQGRNRWPGAALGLCKMALFFNPGGCGTEYLRRVFWLKQYINNERPSDYAFIQSYGWDNYEWLRGTGVIEELEFYGLSNEERFELFINQSQYGRQLNALPSSLRAGHLLGSFESFAGQYFAGVWDESKCILTMNEAERLMQPWWTRWTSTDWGFAHNAVHLWFATGKLSPKQFAEIFGGESQWPIDVVVVYRELVVNEMAEADLAKAIVDLTPEDERRLIQNEWLSPDAWAKKGSANTVAEQMTEVFRRHGLPTPEQADDDRVGGWRLLYNGFRQTCSLRGAEVDAERARQGPLLLVSANCPQTISSLPLLVRDPKKLEDVLKTPTLADDVGDCLRYGFKSQLDPRSKAPRAIRAQEVYDSHESMTAKAMAMLKFNHQEEARRRITRRARAR